MSNPYVSRQKIDLSLIMNAGEKGNPLNQSLQISQKNSQFQSKNKNE